MAVVAGALRGLAKDGGAGYFDWTFLCSDDGNLRGETSVAEYDGYSYFNASGSGLAPGVPVTLRANGLEVGTVTADEWRFVWIDAAAGEPPWPPGGPSMPAALFELPEPWAAPVAVAVAALSSIILPLFAVMALSAGLAALGHLAWIDYPGQPWHDTPYSRCGWRGCPVRSRRRCGVVAPDGDPFEHGDHLLETGDPDLHLLNSSTGHDPCRCN